MHFSMHRRTSRHAPGQVGPSGQSPTPARRKNDPSRVSTTMLCPSAMDGGTMTCAAHRVWARMPAVAAANGGRFRAAYDAAAHLRAVAERAALVAGRHAAALVARRAGVHHLRHGRLNPSLLQNRGVSRGGGAAAPRA